MSKSKPIRKDDLRSVFFMLILFVSVVGGRELGNYYSSYEEISKLKVIFEVTEEELSRYLIDTISDKEANLEISYSITSPRADNSIDIVTSQPDYVRRWLIGVTVSPIIVNQPEASDVEFEMLVEDILVDKAVYEFPREKVSYIGLKAREFQIEIDDIEELKSIVSESAKMHGGEIKVNFRGKVKVHLLFLDTWLPFQVTRHTLIQAPYLEYVSSEWKNLDDEPIDTLELGKGGYVSVNMVNPTRIHSLSEDFVCEFYREGEVEPMGQTAKEVIIPPKTSGKYIFRFDFIEPGEYRYRLVSGDRVITEANNSPILSIK